MKILALVHTPHALWFWVKSSPQNAHLNKAFDSSSNKSSNFFLNNLATSLSLRSFNLSSSSISSKAAILLSNEELMQFMSIGSLTISLMWLFTNYTQVCTRLYIWRNSDEIIIEITLDTSRKQSDHNPLTQLWGWFLSLKVPHEPFKNVNVTMNWDINIVQWICPCQVFFKVLHFLEKDLLWTFEIPIQLPILIAYMNNDWLFFWAYVEPKWGTCGCCWISISIWSAIWFWCTSCFFFIWRLITSSRGTTSRLISCLSVTLFWFVLWTYWSSCLHRRLRFRSSVRSMMSSLYPPWKISHWRICRRFVW